MTRVNGRTQLFFATAVAALVPSQRAESSGLARPSWFRDGGAIHVVEDRGPADHGRRRVQIWREDGRSYEAIAGDDALVQLAEGEDRTTLARFGLDGEELARGPRIWRVWPSRGRAPDDRVMPAGITLAARLADADARAHFPMAVPNLAIARRLATRVPPDDPRYRGQWYLEHAEVEDAWGLSTGTSSVTIVVVDTGCDLGHPDLAAKLDPGIDVIDGDDDPSYDPSYRGAEHGTACAGIVGAATDNGLGIAGSCPDCRVRCVRLIGGSVPIDADVRAFAFAEQVGAAVVSNSWGFVDAIPVPGPLAATMRDVIEHGRNGLGTVVVFAAGNENRELHPDELTSVPGVITVGALTVFDEASSFSNHGADVALTAPMGTLTTDISGAGGADPTDYTNDFGGTSSSCPLVAGIAGLLAAAKPDATAAEIRDALVTTTRPAPYATPDENGHDPLYGYGIVSAARAMRKLLDLPEPGPDAGVVPDASAATIDATITDAGTPSIDAGVASDAAATTASDDGGCTATHATGEESGALIGLFALLLVSTRARGRA